LVKITYRSPEVRTAVSAVIAVFLLLSAGGLAAAQELSLDPTVRQHIRAVADTLPLNSELRGLLERGEAGDGVHHRWMDDMKKGGVNRVLVEVHFTWRGRPVKMQIQKIIYFGSYDDQKDRIADGVKLENIRVMGLEQAVRDAALLRAAKGYWVDLPRPRPKPFLGGTWVELFDDEWLPENPPRYWVYSP